MNTAIKLCFTLAACCLGSVVKKYYTSDNRGTYFSNFIFNTAGSLIAAVMLFIFDGFSRPSPYTAVLAVIFGLLTSLQGFANIAALQCEPLSYTSVIISFSTLLSTLSGVAFFDESISPSQIAGIILMLFSFILAAEHTDENKKKNLKWLILCLIAFFATGGIGILQKIHQNSEYKNELSDFLIISFSVSAIVCGFLALLFVKKECTPLKINKRKAVKFLFIIIISGICIAVNNKLNLYLAGVMDSAVFFPIVNGGGLVLTTAASVAVFKEKLTRKQWIGLLIGIISVVFICIP